MSNPTLMQNRFQSISEPRRDRHEQLAQRKYPWLCHLRRASLRHPCLTLAIRAYAAVLSLLSHEVLPPKEIIILHLRENLASTDDNATWSDGGGCLLCRAVQLVQGL